MKKTLHDDEIETSPGRRVGRRAAVRLAGVAAASGVALATGCGGGRVVRGESSAASDADEGSCADPVGRGRGESGITDSDEAACADPVGRGRGGNRPRTTDSDAGPNADPAGAGRSSVTDSDAGPNADPAGAGRGGSGVVILEEATESGRTD